MSNHDLKDFNWLLILVFLIAGIVVVVLGLIGINEAGDYLEKGLREFSRWWDNISFDPINNPRGVANTCKILGVVGFVCWAVSRFISFFRRK